MCLNQGKAVLCEKPVAMNQNQFNAMIESAKKNRMFFMEALWTRFIPSFLKFKDLVESGTIGEIKIIESDFCFKAPYDPAGRLFNPMLGGGSLLDIGIYPVFMALTMAGVPESMHAMAKQGVTKVDESCSILFKHPKGILSILYSSVVNHGRTQTIIYGSKGYIRLNTMWHMPSSIDLFLNDKDPEHFSFKEPGNGYQYEADEVMNCLNQGKLASEIFTWKDSSDLITTLDKIRAQALIHYPPEIEPV
jgi:predicted dehydrogenase